MDSNIHFSLHGGDLEVGSPPLVLIHGSGGTHLHWPHQLRRLPGHRVYGLDLPGHGNSSGPGETTIEAYVRWIVDWMTAQGIERAIMAGHSMGGAIAMTAALEEADRVAGLVLVGTGGRLRVTDEILLATADPDRFQESVATITGWAFSDSASEQLVSLANVRMSETRPEVIHGDFTACNKFDILDRLSQIAAPTLILCGKQDRLTPVKYSRYLDEQIPESTLVLIKNAGHMVMLEQPVEVTGAIEHFIDRIT